MSDMTDQVGDGDWVTLPEVAELWGTDVLRVRQALKDRHLLASRSDGVLLVPRVFLAEEGPVKGLPGVLTLLSDGGFTDDEALRWLLTPDESIPGTPAQALAENRGTEIKRRAQALAY